MPTHKTPASLEDYVLHLVRLGCEGRCRDVEKLGRRLLRRAELVGPVFAEELRAVLAPHADPKAVLR